MSKLVLSGSVCIALLAASAAVSGAYAANDKIANSAISSANRAYAALVTGRNQAAIQSYSTAIESRQLPVENLGRSLLNRALAYQNSGKFQNAIDDYTSAMALDALSPRMRAVALYNRGLAYDKSGNAAMAIEDFTGALLLDPQFAQSYYSRANVLRRHGQYLLAIADYKKARRFKHAKPYLTLFGEALTYDALNQKTRAKALLLKAIAVKADFKAARLKLADMGTDTQFPSLPLLAPVLASKTTIKPVRMAAVNTIITGSLSPSRTDLTLRKTSLPAPVGVPKSIKAAPQTVQMPALPKVIGRVQAAKPVKVAKTTKVALPAPPALVGVAQKGSPPALSGWTVQLSSQRNSEAAWDVWKNLSERYARLLQGQQATVVKADLGSRGIFYRLRVHQINSKKQAASLCSKLKRKGTGCFVSKA